MEECQFQYLVEKLNPMILKDDTNTGNTSKHMKWFA